MFFGGGAYHIEKIVIPETAKTEDGNIKCRNCEKYELAIGEGKSMRSLAKTIGKMRTHERKCGKKKGIISSVLGIDDTTGSGSEE